MATRSSASDRPARARRPRRTTKKSEASAVEIEVESSDRDDDIIFEEDDSPFFEERPSKQNGSSGDSGAAVAVGSGEESGKPQPQPQSADAEASGESRGRGRGDRTSSTRNGDGDANVELGEDGQPKRRRRRRRRRRGGERDEQQQQQQPNPQAQPRGRGGRGPGSGQGGSGGRRDQQQDRGGRGGHQQQQPQGGRRQQRRQRTPYTGEMIEGTIEGVLELHPKGYGFLRDPTKNYAAQESDSFVSSSVIEKYVLREGVLIRGDVGAGSRGQGPRLKDIETIDGRTPEDYAALTPFEDLTPINPFEQIKLERGPRPMTMRIMDLLTPIGKGQRALLVAPPRTGKTMLLQDIADSVSMNHPEISLIVLLIDERPEEVTEMRRRVKGEVIASSMDRDVESHVRISQLIFERGKRIAEAGGDAFILLDSVTRTARAFNKWVGNTGRTMSGGLDVKAMDIPKKMFGTARRFDEGGSLTVAATALIDTGGRMDEVIFQEFKGTGNMELYLNRDLADRRIWPAIDITRSGTRHEEKILDPDDLESITMMRRSLISLNPVEAMEQLTRTLDRFPTNKEFLTRVQSIL